MKSTHKKSVQKPKPLLRMSLVLNLSFQKQNISSGVQPGRLDTTPHVKKKKQKNVLGVILLH